MRLFILLSYILLLYGCRKTSIAPKDLSNFDPSPTTNYTLAQLINQIPQAGLKQIGNDWVISGIVTADDRSGNFYKQIIIDDGTAAIAVLLDAYNLYTDFPVGRKLYIHCKGLAIGYYYKLPQLGYAQQAQLGPLPFLLFDKYMEKGPVGNPVVPITITAADAAVYHEELLNKLVTITDIQVTDTAASYCFALPPEQTPATNVRMDDCSNHRLTLRTSGYSNFRACRLPRGRGTLTAIYTTYNSTPQLILRDTSDINCKGPRCP